MHALLLILDLDGTIVRLPIDYPAMRNVLHQHFLEYGIDKEFRPLYKTIQDCLETIKTGVSEHESRKAFQTAMNIIERYELESIDRCELLEGADDFIKKMKQREKKIIIFSSNTKKCIEGALIKFDLNDYIDMIISVDDVKKLKPSIEGISIITQIFDVNPNDIVLIGDTTHDMEAAKKFGSKAIGVLTGAGSKEDLKKHGATEIYENLSRCIEVVK